MRGPWMPAATIAALLVAPVLAGCVGLPGGPGPTPGPPGPGLASPLLTQSLVGTNVSTEWPGAEPVVAIAPDGTIYVEGVGFYQPDDGTPSRGVNKVFRSTDGGATWTDVTPQGPGQELTGDGFVAVGPDGAVYAANVFQFTFQVYRSTDRGETWTLLNVPRLPLLMHRHWIEAVEGDTVHVTLEALPPGVVPALFGGPNLEGAVDHPNQGMWYLRSTDGGDTWEAPLHIDPQINYVGQSNMAVTDDGQGLYVVRYEEDDEDVPLDYSYDDGSFYLLASEDGGDTWERREMFPLGTAIGSALTSLAVDADGRLSFVFARAVGNASIVHVAVSEDGGGTWDVRAVGGALGPGTQAMPFATATGPGELALVWYEAPVEGLPAEVDAGWRVRAARLSGVGDGVPHVRERWRTPWVVHQGNICVFGPACSGEEDRSLLDYPWAAVGPEGGVHLAWASTVWDRPSAFPVYGNLTVPVGAADGS